MLATKLLRGGLAGWLCLLLTVTTSPQIGAQTLPDCDPSNGSSVASGDVFLNYGSFTNARNRNFRSDLSIGQPMVGEVFNQNNSGEFGFYGRFLLPPQAPSLTASQGDFPDRILLTWAVDPLSAEASRGFTIKRDGAFLAELDAGTEQFIDFNAQPGEFYDYTIAGINDFGEGFEGTSVGFVNPNGVVSGRITTRVGNPVAGATVTLEPTIGRSLAFDGNSYVCLNHEDRLLTDEFTFAAWVRVEAGQDRAMIVDRGQRINKNFWITSNALGADAGAIVGIGGGAAATEIPVSFGPDEPEGWHHLAVVYTGGSAIVYVDGKFADAEKVIYESSATSFRFGQDFDDGAGFRGGLDDIKLYNRYLTQTELMETMNVTASSGTVGLVAYWKCDEGIGRKIFDTAGGDIDGFLEGATFSDNTANVKNGAISDDGGYYIIEGINYSAAENFRAKPQQNFYTHTSLEFNAALQCKATLPSFNVPDSATLELTVQPFALSGIQTILSRGDGQGISVGLNDDQLSLTLNGETQIVGTLDQSFQHLAFTIDPANNEVVVYRNAELFATLAFANVRTGLSQDGWAIGATATGGDHFTGLVGELALLDTISSITQLQIHASPLVSDNATSGIDAGDGSLVVYFPLDDSRGTVLENLGPVTTIGDGTLVNASFSIVDFRQKTTPHEYRPAQRVVNLNGSVTAVGNIDFTDESTVTVSGVVRFSDTYCYQDSVTMYIDDEPVYPSILTDENGRFVVDVEPGSSFRLEPRYEADSTHRFLPVFYEVSNISRPIAGVLFQNTTKRFISGQVAGGKCMIPINYVDNPLELTVRSLNGCYEKTVPITAFDGNYNIGSIPPIPVTIAVTKHLDNDVYTFFQNTGGEETDLRTVGGDTINFVYTSSPQVEVQPFPTVTMCNGEDVAYVEQSDVTNNSKQHKNEIQVFENYLGGRCELDSFRLEVRNDVEGRPELQTFIVRDTTVFPLTYYVGVPNFNGDFKKTLDVTAYNTTGSSNAVQRVVVTGRRSREQEFSTVAPNWPIMVVHDPPGDGSFASWEEETTRCTNISEATINDNTRGGGFNVNLGPKITSEAGSPFFSIITEIAPIASTEFRAFKRTVQDTTTVVQTCFTPSRSFSTSDGDDVIGDDADIFIGTAMNILIGKDDVLKYDETSCEFMRSEQIRVSPESFSTEYVYSSWFIETKIIPELDSLAATHDSLANKAEDAARWREILADNQRNKDNSKFKRNYSFDGLASISESLTNEADTASTKSIEIEMTRNTATELGVLFNDAGGTAVIDFTFVDQVSNDTTITTGESTTTHFTLADDDTNDNFTVDVRTDPVFNTPVFRLIAGQSMCPWEEGTLNREQVSFTADRFSQVNVPENDVATFPVTLTNDSQTGADALVYVLGEKPGTNPNGALIRVNGLGLLGPQRYQLFPGESIDVLVTVAKGPTAYEYDDLTLFMASECMLDHAQSLGYNLSNQTIGPDSVTMEGPYDKDDLAKFYKEIKFNVDFIEPCSDVEITFPMQDWVVTPNDNDALGVTISDYDLADVDLDTIRLQYRVTGGNGSWINIYEWPKDSFVNYPVGRVLTWDMAELRDGPYEIRAVAACRDLSLTPGLSTVIKGRKETRPPAMLGTAEPADGLLSPGDEISITFTKRIDCGKVFQADGIGTNININNLALIDKSTGTLVDATITCSGDKILIVPNIGNRFIENRTLGVVANNIEDLYGNQSDSLHWEFFVNRSNLYWVGGSINERVQEGDRLTLTREIRNQGGEITSFNIDGLPSWVEVFPRSGSLQPGERQVVNFEFPADLSANKYITTIEMRTVDGVEPLPVDLRVLCEGPEWAIDPGNYRYSTNFTLELNIQGELSADPEDLVSAFVGEEIRGVAEIRKFDDLQGASNQYLAFLTVYSNQLSNEIVYFRIWDASECLLYGQTLEQFPFEADQVVGAPLQPQTVHTNGNILKKVYFNPGWNWFSYNLDLPVSTVTGTLQTLTTAGPVSVIRSRAAYAQYSPRSDRWFGSLRNTRVEDMYQLLLYGNDSLTLVGSAIEHDRPIDIVAGWNWIGYLPNRGLPISTALNSIQGQNGDLIKSQTAFSQYVAGLGWVGSLRFLASPAGYLMQTREAGTLIYPDPDTVGVANNLAPATAPTSGRTVASLEEMSAYNASLVTLAATEDVQMELDSTPMHWLVDRTQYEHSMNVLAIVTEGEGQEILADGDEVGAFVNGELRGADRVLYVPELDRYLMFLTVYGDLDGQTVEYRIYDRSEETVMDLENDVPFGINDVVGTVAMPHVFKLSTTSAEDHLEQVAADLRVYPNPSKGLVTVEFTSGISGPVTLRIRDFLGRQVASGAIPARKGMNQTQWDAGDVPNGIYILSIERDGQHTSRRVQIQR